MHAPEDAGTGGHAGGHDGGNGDVPQDISTDGDAGSGCVAGDGGPDAASCPATFNFENCALYGAYLNDATNQSGFTSFGLTSSQTACGMGALQIEVDVAKVSTDAGTTSRGEMYLPLGGIDLSGKTLTIRVKAVPAGSTIRLNIIPVLPLSYGGTTLGVSPIPADWTTRSVTFDSVDSGVTVVDRLSIYLTNISTTDRYVGTLYLDEIDISTPPVDGGTGDGAVPDGGASDLRQDSGASDAPAGDVRDGSAAN
jgi:hypothetical protein